MTSSDLYNDPAYDSAIAVIGMSGRFPGARDIETFWRNIAGGVKSIRFFSDEELLAMGLDPEMLAQPNCVKAGSLLEEIDQFDASFFGYTPREAEVMDPQHRFFLECAWETLESAGYSPENTQHLIGIFAGSGFCSYLVRNLFADPAALANVGMLQVSIGNERDALTSSVAYKLNLKGPCVAVQTFCSTSLVAIHMACQSLLHYECDMALAGGVAIDIPPAGAYLYTEGGIVSPDGECRTFDAHAQGSVMGNGAGVVLLKRLRDALEEGDPLYAIVRGSAVNNDGSQRVSITAPGLDGQTEVIAEAISNSGVPVESIGYIEAHGTATEMGDAVELSAMMKAFAETTEQQQFCALGSVKPNVGHLDRASGVTGFIKTVLALKHRQLPPSLNFERTNSDIDLEQSPFYVNTRLQDWPAHADQPRRAGVSSFGLGGTNAHIVLEEPVLTEAGGPSRPYQLLLLSAKSETALQKMTANLGQHLQNHAELSLADVAFTLQTGRSIFGYRRMLVCQERGEAIDALLAADPKRTPVVQEAFRDRPVVFLFPGVGEQYTGVARELYNTEQVFREVVDQCCASLQDILDADLRELLFPGEAAATSSAPNLRALLGKDGRGPGVGSQPLKQTANAQPAVFVIEYALARLLMSWGIRPQAMLGYSVGEYVAACLASVLSLEDALTLVARRAQLIQDAPGGAMLAVALSEKQIQPYLSAEVSLAVMNGPMTSVLAGPHEAIVRVETLLDQREIVHRRVEATHAFHSAMLEPLREAVEDLTRPVTLHPPEIPYISNVSGTWITEEQATDHGYWAEHMCRTVRFADGIALLLQKPETLLLEVGPGQSLCSFVKQHPACDRQRMALVMPTLPSVYERGSDLAFLLTQVGKLWLAGVTLDWQGFSAHEERRRVVLPTYPFERQRYWIAPAPAEQRVKRQEEYTGPNDDLERIEDVGHWFFAPGWRQAPPPTLYQATSSLPTAQRNWLLLSDSHGVGQQLGERLRQAGQQVTLVSPGDGFANKGNGVYCVRPSQRSDYEALLEELLAQGKLPEQIVHLWTLTAGEQQPTLEEIVQNGFYSLLALTQALGDQDFEHCTINVVSNHTHIVLGNEQLSPEKALLVGPCRVIAQEYTNLNCRLIDVEMPEGASSQGESFLAPLLDELVAETDEALVALRGKLRWIQSFEPVPLPAHESGSSEQRLRQRGVYLITGGLGGIALEMAGFLAREYQARLALTVRRELPPRERWPQIVADQGEQSNDGARIRKVMELEAAGAEVLIVKADVANEAEMRAALEQTLKTFGELHGVLHVAGVAGAGVIQLKTWEQSASVLASKVQGTLVLERVLGERELDFLVLFSSMASTTGGGPGQVDYCAANAFLDAYARRHSGEHGITMAIAWGEWQWNAWETELKGYDIEAQEFFKAHRQKFGISFADGIEAFKRMIATRLPNIVVSTQDLRQVAERSKQFTAAAVLQHTQQSREGRERYPRPDLASSYVMPSTELERQITAIWEDLLGVSPVGIDDNFFELGGNSLTGIDVIARMKKKLGAKTLAAHVIYEAPTVSALAHYIEQGKTEVAVEEWQARSERRRAGMRQRVREAGRSTV